MNDLLSNPAILSGVIPLVTALATAWLLKHFGGVWPGLAFTIAYYFSVYLVIGFQVLPFTSTRKILLLGIIAIVIGLIADTVKIKPKALPTKTVPLIVFAFGTIAAAWVIWPVLTRQEGLALWAMLIPALLYTGWLTSATNSLRIKTDHAAMVALALGLGTGVSAILGASALIGQLGIAIAAIAGAFLLLSLFKQEITFGNNFVLPAGLLSGLLGIAAVIYASLPWFCLIPLIAIPLVTYVPLPINLTKFKKLLMLATYTLPFALLAIGIAWVSTGSSDSMY